VTLGQRGLDDALAIDQPVHRRVDLVTRGFGDRQVCSERGVGPPPDRRQLRRRTHHTRDHQCHCEIALWRGRAQELGQIQLAGHLPHGGHIAVWQGTHNVECVIGPHHALAAQHRAHRFYGLGRQM
jgi:hypothetical protein